MKLPQLTMTLFLLVFLSVLNADDILSKGFKDVEGFGKSRANSISDGIYRSKNSEPSINYNLKKPVPKKLLFAKVVKVNDGDSFEIELNDGSKKIVHFFSIDAPELNQDYGKKAKMFLSKKILKKDVAITYAHVDEKGSLIGHVKLGKKSICELMLKSGHAWLNRKNVFTEQLFKLELTAKSRGLGLWSNKRAQAPWDYLANQSALSAKQVKISTSSSAK